MASGKSRLKCFMHFEHVVNDITSPFTPPRWSKYRECLQTWLQLDGECHNLASRHQHPVDVEFTNIPAEAGFHPTCYQRFINKRLIELSSKKCLKRQLQQSLDSEGSLQCSGSVHTGQQHQSAVHRPSPRKKLRSRSDLHTPKHVLPAVCIICKKADRYIRVSHKTTKDSVMQAETLTAGEYIF